MLTYNRANLVPNAIQSILNQTYQNFELIIINDASTDNTSDIISKYAKDPRIKIITNTTNKGIVYNRNLGIKLSQGKYISWLDDDDLAEKNKLEEQVKFLEKHQDITILGTQISLLGSQRMVHLWPTETDYKKTEISFLIGRLPIILPTTMWRSSFIKKHNITFDTNIPLVEDFAIYDKVLALKGKIMTLDKTLYQYRFHYSNPKEYYQKITEINKTVYHNRWKKFYPDTPFPDTQCKRLKHIKDNNKYFSQAIVDNMYSFHCRTKTYNPSSFGRIIIHNDNTKEPIVISKNNYTFYSNKLQKIGKVKKITNDSLDILWDDKTKPITYKSK
jgi:glycosyltransferase involved in cell wall biosynthesis